MLGVDRLKYDPDVLKSDIRQLSAHAIGGKADIIVSSTALTYTPELIETIEHVHNNLLADGGIAVFHLGQDPFQPIKGKDFFDHIKQFGLFKNRGFSIYKTDAGYILRINKTRGTVRIRLSLKDFEEFPYLRRRYK